MTSDLCALALGIMEFLVPLVPLLIEMFQKLQPLSAPVSLAYL